MVSFCRITRTRSPCLKCTGVLLPNSRPSATKGPMLPVRCSSSSRSGRAGRAARRSWTGRPASIPCGHCCAGRSRIIEAGPWHVDAHIGASGPYSSLGVADFMDGLPADCHSSCAGYDPSLSHHAPSCPCHAPSVWRQSMPDMSWFIEAIHSRHSPALPHGSCPPYRPSCRPW